MEATVYKNNIKILICWQSKLQSGEPIDQWIDGSIDWLMVQWMDRLNDQWVDGSMDGWMDQMIYESMDWSIDGSIDW